MRHFIDAVPHGGSGLTQKRPDFSWIPRSRFQSGSSTPSSPCLRSARFAMNDIVRNGSSTEACLKPTSQHHLIEGRCDGTHGRSCQARWGGLLTVQRRPFIVSGDFERDRRCAKACRLSATTTSPTSRSPPGAAARSPSPRPRCPASWPSARSTPRASPSRARASPARST